MERLDVFMARANAAYYAAHDPFADFTTSPEIAQVFGELLGLWAAVTWAAMGRPDPVRLVEAGPGRGTLMRDALRAVRGVAPDFAAAARVHFLEFSARLRELQRALVPAAVWHDDLASVPPGPMILLANEFLDALPIRQFVQTADGWAERFVEDGAFVLVPVTLTPAALTPAPSREGRERGRGGTSGATTPPLPCFTGEGRGEGSGRVHEINEPALAFTAAVAARIATEGGAALLIDYGPERSAPGDSLQALRHGRSADPLSEPGSADLTAHVDFAALAQVASDHGAVAHGPVAQGQFLTRLGLFQRTDRLARGQPPARVAALVDAARRLAEPAAMGTLFKVLAVTHPALPVPEGFSA